MAANGDRFFLNISFCMIYAHHWHLCWWRAKFMRSIHVWMNGCCAVSIASSALWPRMDDWMSFRILLLITMQSIEDTEVEQWLGRWGMRVENKSTGEYGSMYDWRALRIALPELRFPRFVWGYWTAARRCQPQPGLICLMPGSSVKHVSKYFYANLW